MTCSRVYFIADGCPFILLFSNPHFNRPGRRVRLGWANHVQFMVFVEEMMVENNLLVKGHKLDI